MPLRALRADIDYGFAEANDLRQIGIKVWLYKGERLVPQHNREKKYRERARGIGAGRRRRTISKTAKATGQRVTRDSMIR
jgi:ribosomal protein S3